MTIHDEEDLLQDVRDHLQANLGTKITAIDTEKADFTLDTITADDDHFLIAGEFSEIPNHIFLILAIDGEIENSIVFDDLSSTVPIVIKVVFADKGDSNTYFRALRYMRALVDAMLEYEPATPEVAGLQITKSMPMVVELDKRQLVTSGIALSIKIA